MDSNEKVVQKAAGDFSSTNLAVGGALNPEQASKFIRKLIKEPTILRDIRTVEMTSPVKNVNKIQFNKRILRAGGASR